MYSGGLLDTTRDLNVSDDLVILGISLYVLGFALGSALFTLSSRMFQYSRLITYTRPLFFAPLGEVNFFSFHDARQYSGCSDQTRVSSCANSQMFGRVIISDPRMNCNRLTVTNLKLLAYSFSHDSFRLYIVPTPRRS